MREINFIFFGSSPISVTALEELRQAGMRPLAVVTQPDKKQGRGLNLTPSPVKAWATAHRGIPIEYWTPDINELKQRLAKYNADVFVLVSFGKILPREILDMPRKGIVNLHPSLLPLLRGPSPIESTILLDMKDDVGVTIMLLTEKMDEGPILAQRKVEVNPPAGGWPIRRSELYSVLSMAGAKLLVDTLPLWIEDKIAPVAQDSARATYSRMIDKSDGEIDLEADPYQNFLKFCALEGWPGTYFYVEHSGRRVRVKIIDAAHVDGQFRILKVTPEGKREMLFEDFKKGYQINS